MCGVPTNVCRPRKGSGSPDDIQARCYRHRKGWVRVYPQIASIYP